PFRNASPANRNYSSGRDSLAANAFVLNESLLRRVVVSFPAEIILRGFLNGARHRREVRRDVVLETVLTDVAKELLHLRNFHNSGATKCFQRIVGEFPFAHVAANHTAGIYGR